MTGMKEGAGEDPFAEDESPGKREPEDRRAATESAETDSEPVTRESESRRSGRTQMQIPYKFRRDGVQDGRDRVPLFLHGETKSAERDALRELEDRFDADVSLTDVREALVMVGLEHLDEVEDQLEEWGYGMTFE
jgi:hypothetical protein